ncbi:MAG: hybrid sensor histidine kinase/response regulator [Thermoflavifilum aggregans]|nr:hybrid sensor histidine kinase/response regulator [Thermoflavifilum aggregans]
MPAERIRILYVDDEVNNLAAFRATFRRDYDVFTAPHFDEAYQILEQEQPIHLVIADQRMPGMTGVEFLADIRKKYPDPLRVLLTAHMDMEALIEAVNEGRIYRYIRKPWNEAELHNTIHNAYEIYTTRVELREKMQMLEKTNDELSRFIYSVSHDLRSPLMSVLGILNLAKMDQSVIDPNGYMQMIETSVLRLDDFIQKIIEYYKNSRLEIEYEPINFRQQIEDAIESFRHLHLNVEFKIDVDQPVPFIGDNFRVNVVLNNLISNAIKYQKPDEQKPWVAIRVKVNPSQAVIEVSDNGIGIVQEHLQNIFKMFFRTKSLNKPGAGIGLYIAKEAVNRMGGTIDVRSVYGEGTTFEVCIPNHLEHAR